MSVLEPFSVDINSVTADTVDFHFQLMARCLSPTSVPFLACGGSGRLRCHLAAHCHVWADAGPGPPSPGLLLLLLHGGAPTGLGCGPWWGKAEEGGGVGVLTTDSSTLAVLRSTAEGKSCAFEVGTSESLFTQAGEGGSWPAAQECLCHDGSGREEECAPQSQHCRSRATAEVAAISSYLF